MNEPTDPQQPAEGQEMRTFPGCFAQLGPIATSVMVGQDADGRSVVVLHAETGVGMLLLMLEPDHAERVSKELAVGAAKAKTGLTIVGNV